MYNSALATLDILINDAGKWKICQIFLITHYIRMENMSFNLKRSVLKTYENYYVGVMLGAEYELLLIINFVNAFNKGGFFSYLLLTLLKYLS